MIPQGWEEKSLYDIAEITTGKWDANHSVESGLYKFYTCASEPLLCNTFRYCGDCLIFPGNGANVGDVYRYSGKFDAYQRTYVASNIKHINVSYLYYFLLLYWKKANSDKQYGSATNYIKIGNFKDFIISYPPLPEQERIVAKLDKAFEAIDKVKANAEKNLNNAKELFESALNRFFTENTEGWEEKTLGSISDLKQNKAEVKNIDANTLVSFVPMEYLGINQKYFNSNQSKPIKNLIKSYTYFAENDVIMAKITPCFENGKIGIARGLMNKIGFGSSEYIVFRTNKDINSEYLYYFLNRETFRKEGAQNMLGAVGHKRVSKEFIENYPFSYPSLLEQQKIVEKLDALQEQTKHLEQIYTQKIKECDELKQSILQKAFRGGL